MGRCRRIVLGLGVAALVGSAASAEPFLRPADSTSPPVVSVSQRFVFRGFDRRDATRLASWTDEAARALEDRLGRPLPFERFEMVRLEGTESPSRAPGEIYVGQSLLEGALQQRMVVANPAGVDEESLLEAVTQVLLNRIVLRMRRSSGPLPGGSLVPDWFSVGMAQNLRADLRRRNAEFTAEQLRLGEPVRVSEVLSRIRLPAGRTGDKAWCGVVVAWLEQNGFDEDGWAAVLRRFAEEEPVDAGWIADRLPEAGDARAVDMRWDLWLAKTAGPVRALGEVDFEQVKVLKQRLDIRLIDYGLEPVEGVPARLTPEDLFRYRTEPWARAIALRVASALREDSVGRAPEWVRVAGAYANFLDGVGAGRGAVVGEAALAQRLAGAEAAMARLEKEVALQAHLVRKAASREAPPGDAPEPASAPQAVPAPEPETVAAEPASPPTEATPLKLRRRRFLDALEATRPGGS